MCVSTETLAGLAGYCTGCNPLSPSLPLPRRWQGREWTPDPPGKQWAGCCTGCTSSVCRHNAERQDGACPNLPPGESLALTHSAPGVRRPSALCPRGSVALARSVPGDQLPCWPALPPVVTCTGPLCPWGVIFPASSLPSLVAPYLEWGWCTQTAAPTCPP